ncbi:MAG: LLM class flavin-dependent oxidoreductase [Halobacteria archaeon]|nr:LLM class flavin-dependent oxidoreductase [Halobacteria archaeon]
MRLGYSITSFHTLDKSPNDGAEDIVSRVEAAEEAGYDYVEAGDHHVVAGGQYFQNVPTGARLTQVFDHVAVMFLLPLYNPVLVAEQAGTIAAFAEEFDFWCAVGGQREAFEAFGVPLKERAPRMEEGLSLIRRLWDEDEVNLDGDFYSVEGVSVNPKADPRICIGGSAEPAVRRAGRLGDAWVAGPAETKDDIKRKKEWFEEAGGGDLLVRREVMALRDGDKAQETANEKLSRGYRGWPQDAEWVISGDSDDVASEFEALRELGVDEVIVRPMSDRHAVETLRVVSEAL